MLDTTGYFGGGLNTLLFDGNPQICGVVPQPFINASSQGLIVGNGGGNALWCTTFFPIGDGCQPLQLPGLMVLFPSDNDLVVPLSNIPSYCFFYLPQIQLASIRLDYSTSVSINATSATGNSITFARQYLLSDEIQYGRLQWQYQNGVKEMISMQMKVYNLPFAQITGINRPIIYSSGTGQGQQLVAIYTDQNMTLYKKESSAEVRCGVQPDGYFVAAQLSLSENAAFCLINIGLPNTGPKWIQLFDNSSTVLLTSNNATFYLTGKSFISLFVCPSNFSFSFFLSISRHSCQS